MSEPPDDSDDDVTAMVATGVSGSSDPTFDRSQGRLQQGDHVDRYVILSELGEGGMGVVYRAYDPKLCREVALKCLRVDALDRAAEARLVREAQVMAKLNHPNVVPVFDVEVAPSGLVLAMEYVSGGTLKTWLHEDRSWRQVIGRFIEAGRGLGAAHEASIIHRDFKPANVLVAEDGRVKVTDFGLAKGVLGNHSSSIGPGSDPPSGEQRSYESESLEMPLTRADTVMGTPRYMAPEQHAGREADTRSDQYSFCIALWEALVGKPPYGSRGADLGKDKLGGPPPWPKGVAVPRVIVRAIERGLAPAPSKRWPSMQDLLEALSFDPDRRRRNTSVWAGATALGVASVAGVYLWSAQRRAVCDGGDGAIAEVWNAQRAESAKQAFGRRGEWGARTWVSLAAVMDDYTAGWASKYREVCEATRLRGEQSETSLELRMACLERGRQHLDAVAAALESGGDDVVDHGVEVVETIDPLRWCDDTEILAEEPEGSGEPGGLGSQIRRLQVLAVASELLEARKLRDSTASSVEAVDSPLLRARWELAAGRLAEAAYEPDEARAHLDRALTLALEHGPPRIALQAAIGLVRVLEPDPERVHEAGWLARVALGLARRIDAGGPAEAAVLVEQAKVASAEGQSDEALASLQSALDMVRGRPIGRYGEAQVTGELAVVSARSGDAEAARRRLKDARVLFDERWGRRHPRFGQLLVRLGEGLRLGGHPREALTLLEEARRLFDDAGWGDTVDAARAWLEVGRARAEAGHVDAAIFEIAAAKLDAALGETHPATLDAVAERAHWARRSGDLGGAAVLYVQLLGDVEARYTKVHPRYVAVLLELASTRREQGQPEESIELLRRARDLVGDVRAPVELQLRIALSLTELNADRDPTEAERYLEEARALADDAIDAALLARLTASEEKLSTKSRTRR